MRGGASGAANAFLLAALFLAAALAQAQAPATWDELAGGAGRTGAAFLPATTLDVLESRDLFDNATEIDLLYSKAFVSTPHGLLALAQGSDAASACTILTIGATVEERALDGCTGGTLTAYDRVNDRLLICSEGQPTDAIFQSRDATTGELAWSVSAVDLGSRGAPFLWNCRGTALTGDGAAYVAFWNDAAGLAGAAHLARIQLSTGSIDWARPVSAADFFRGSTPVPSEVANAGTGGFFPYGISVTEGGIVLSGRVTCACGKGDPFLLEGRLEDRDTTTVQGAVGWLRPNGGDFVGVALAEDDPAAIASATNERWFGQWWAPTQGPLATFAIGERVLVVNPTEADPVRAAPFSGIETGRGFFGIIPSVWWDDIVLVPMAKTVTAIDPNSKDLVSPWSRAFGPDSVVSGLLVLPPAEALVLVANNSEFKGADIDTNGTIHRIDLTTGSELQRIPLPGTIRMTGGTGRVAFHPLEDGRLLILSLDGRLFILGAADPGLLPRIVVSNEYPAPSEGVSVQIDAPTDDATYLIAWGDSTVEEGGTSWGHRYGDVGPHTIRVTALFADGRTATSERVVRVGATPPPELNALQTAFSDKWQNVTFGILGILVTLLGALIAFLVRRRRRGRLHEELSMLELIRERGRSDSEGAIRELGAFRERLLADVHTHRIDDAQFNTLEARANVVFGALRMRLLGALAGRLSADFRHALDVVLHDGRVDADELATLRSALAAEREVGPDERARLLALLDRMRA